MTKLTLSKRAKDMKQKRAKQVRKPTKDINLQLYANGAEGIKRLVELTGKKRMVVLRALIPSVAISEAIAKYASLMYRDPESNDAALLQRVFIQNLAEMMQHHSKYKIPLQSIAQRLTTVGVYEDDIAKLFCTWANAIKGEPGYRFCQATFEKGGTQHETQIVLGPGQDEQTECDRIVSVIGDEVLEIDRVCN